MTFGGRFRICVIPRRLSATADDETVTESYNSAAVLAVSAESYDFRRPQSRKAAAELLLLLLLFRVSTNHDAVGITVESKTQKMRYGNTLDT